MIRTSILAFALTALGACSAPIRQHTELVSLTEGGHLSVSPPRRVELAVRFTGTGYDRAEDQWEFELQPMRGDSVSVTIANGMSREDFAAILTDAADVRGLDLDLVMIPGSERSWIRVEDPIRSIQWRRTGVTGVGTLVVELVDRTHDRGSVTLPEPGPARLAWRFADARDDHAVSRWTITVVPEDGDEISLTLPRWTSEAAGRAQLLSVLDVAGWEFDVPEDDEVVPEWVGIRTPVRAFRWERAQEYGPDRLQAQLVPHPAGAGRD